MGVGVWGCGGIKKKKKDSHSDFLSGLTIFFKLLFIARSHCGRVLWKLHVQVVLYELTAPVLSWVCGDLKSLLLSSVRFSFIMPIEI